MVHGALEAKVMLTRLRHSCGELGVGQVRNQRGTKTYNLNLYTQTHAQTDHEHTLREL